MSTPQLKYRYASANEKQVPFLNGLQSISTINENKSLINNITTFAF